MRLATQDEIDPRAAWIEADEALITGFRYLVRLAGVEKGDAEAFLNAWSRARKRFTDALEADELARVAAAE